MTTHFQKNFSGGATAANQFEGAYNLGWQRFVCTGCDCLHLNLGL